jgi:hypothetical protein
LVRALLDELDRYASKLDAETKRADGNYAWGQSLLEEIKGYESRLGECLDVLRPIALALDQGHPIEPGSFSHDEAKRLTESVVERSVPKGDRFTGTDCDFYEPGNGNACMNCGTMHGSE